MNDKIIGIFDASGMSKYALAKKSGLPYTTVNEVMNRKLDINRCSVETVYKFAVGLNKSVEELINDFPCLDKAEKAYGSIKYKWYFKPEENGIIFKSVEGKTVVIAINAAFSVVEHIDLYEKCAEFALDGYMRQQMRNNAMKHLAERIT